MLVSSIAALLLVPAYAQQDTPDVEAHSVAPVDSLSADLDSAINTYFSGELERARDRLRELGQDPAFQDHPKRLEAMVYLAEVEYYLGERDSSWASCVAVLAVDPTYRIDPFVHPPELVAFFDSVRAATVQPTSPKNNPRKDVPPWTILVPGAPQLYSEQERFGYLVIGSISALTATSMGLYVALRRYDLDLNRPGIQVSSPNDQAQADRLLLWTNTTRWLALGVWGASIAEALFVDNRSMRPLPVSLHPTGVRMHWEWP